ncbi:unnamed protein product [Caenorhabditis auriculariae]|uniref:C3H1-type domain-containing protein n=1 Tax=Caenorhabditis auriculariae TaxID=2777116 RepID=A0A8S1HFX0_9PELO|nr:unnamed protein product [Caenorhabditis auriculariae]
MLFVMVDIMSHNQKDILDVEDGELMEDGEICDDEEDPSAGSANSKNPTDQPVPSLLPLQRQKKAARRSDETNPTDGFASRIHPAKKTKIVNQKKMAIFSAPEVKTKIIGLKTKAMEISIIDKWAVEEDRPYAGRAPFGRGFRGKRYNTEHQICKFFREGYCRDGDQCSYSHQAEDSLRRPELCKFYLSGFCKKGLQCLMLHGEYPCKMFHKGECTRDPCRFSHVPATDYTRPLIEKMIADDEARALPPQPQFPPAPPRGRRVLLPGGPAPVNPTVSGSTPPQQGVLPPAAVIHAPLPPQQQTSNGQIAPPSIVVPKLALPQRPPLYPPQQPVTSGFFGAPHTISTAPKKIEPPKPAAPAPENVPFNLDEMLNKLANQSGYNTINESPASPPPMHSEPLFAVPMIPNDRAIRWRLFEVKTKPLYFGIDDVEHIRPNDPRRSRVLSSTFDAHSQMLTLAGRQVLPPDQPVDPRLRSQPEPVAVPKASPTLAPFSSWMPQV